MTPYYQDDAVTVHAGDCLGVIRELPDHSVDAVVTDPPAGINFMGRTWDHHRGGRQQWIAWLAEVMAEALRATKPGGHALVWALPRTSHWTATALEDAGWEVRDCITHLFGSGFPKSLDVSKAIDRAAGAEREVVGIAGRSGSGRTAMDSGTRSGDLAGDYFTSTPATDDARRWQGWGTSLKPASEHWWLARKPLSGTVAATVLEYGTGALNIDATRVGRVDGDRTNYGLSDGAPAGIGYHGLDGRTPYDGSAGRWPPNVVLDGAAANELDRSVGPRTSGANPTRRGVDGDRTAYGDFAGQDDANPQRGAETGLVSRFFPTFRYEPKAGSAERPRVSRDEPDGREGRIYGKGISDVQPQCRVCGSKTLKPPDPNPACGHGDWEWVPTTPRGDHVAHPTVKPLALVRWLVKLVTPPGGTVLEPFAGSGTTAEACVIEGFKCIAIERDETYLPLIKARLSKPIQVALDFEEGA